MQSKTAVSVVQHAPGDMDQRDANIDYIVERLGQEAAKGSQLVVFPEMGITSFFRHEPGGYERYWREATIELDGPELKQIIDAASAADVHAVVGFAERSATTGVIYNSAALVGPDGVLGVTRKVHLPGLEKLYYTPSDEIEVIDSPLGRIGIAICYDAMFPEYFRALSDQGAEIIVFCSSTWRGGAKGGVGLEGPEVFGDDVESLGATGKYGEATLSIWPESGTMDILGITAIEVDIRHADELIIDNGANAIGCPGCRNPAAGAVKEE